MQRGTIELQAKKVALDAPYALINLRNLVPNDCLHFIKFFTTKP